MVQPGPGTDMGTFESSDEYDMPAEVDATVRTLRRVAVSHVAVFLGVVLVVPFLTLALDWWSEGRLIGGMSPNFAMAAFGLYIFFFVLAIAAARLSNAVEHRMLGGSDHDLHEAVTDDLHDDFTDDFREDLTGKLTGDRPADLHNDQAAGQNGKLAGGDGDNTDGDTT
ncbi:hypothetical protein [Phytoactinopolyspora halophila]|uniref:hypothetical protein n=1 Tax=Phytoactinopolyspora halophila TaxID=1981511 RepID=UPI001B8B21A8|nr:hypothetical protein [Phytoactinopolyspora halophila]